MQSKYIYFGIGASVTLTLGIIIAYWQRERIYSVFDYKTNILLLTLEKDVQKKVKVLLSRAKKQGIELRITSAYRSCEEQDQLFAQGRTAPGRKVTNARCGQSAHNHRIAVDVVEFQEGEPIWENPRWETIGAIGESAGLKWGGRWKNFKDRPHFYDPTYS
ncbi:MAG: M15 family metallopeptidase [Cyclobacteriaceae bacterium]